MLLPGGNAIGQRGHVAFHGPAQSDENYKGQIVLSPLDPADIAAIQPRLMRQALLRHTEPAPSRANTLAENIEIRVHPPMSPGR